MKTPLALFAITAALLPSNLNAAQCTAESGPQRVPLLELYTSEGCDSCPTADRWMSALPLRGFSPERVVALGFHVDYWDYLGWTDPFAKSEFSARQRKANRRNQARVIYTPQLLLNGKDYRRGVFKDSFVDEVSMLNRSRPGARITLQMATEPAEMLRIEGTAYVPEPARRSDARVYFALYENKLSNEVKAGENRGKRLKHDFVVRELAGPYPVGGNGTAAFSQRLKLDVRWKPFDLHVAAFVQDERTGEVLQALAMPYCGHHRRAAGGG